MKTAMHQKWRELLDAWAVGSVLVDETFELISRHYASLGRYYHTLDHIQSVLETVEDLRAHTRNFNAVRLAAWLHDVIYDSNASDNEERSAEFAMQLCEKLAIPDGALIAGLIIKTKTHDAGDDPDAKVLLDADLAILGASDSVYRAYAANIRREYEWVSETEYRTARSHVLAKFLARPRIFHFFVEFEGGARHNIAAEIVSLNGR